MHSDRFLEPRRAAVALLVRVVPAPTAKLPDPAAPPPSLTDFFEQDWVKDPNSCAEILFLHREGDTADNASTTHTGMRNQREAHVAFPGGRAEPDDEGELYTGTSLLFFSTLCAMLTSIFFFKAMRQTWEETGIDLAEKYYVSVGQLDDREITTSLGKRLLMILSPYVFLQVTPTAPPPDPITTTTLHWIPLASIASSISSSKWSTVPVDAASRIAPRSSLFLRLLIRTLVGRMEFPAIILQPSNPTDNRNSTDKKKKHKHTNTQTEEEYVEEQEDTVRSFTFCCLQS